MRLGLAALAVAALTGVIVRPASAQLAHYQPGYTETLGWILPDGDFSFEFYTSYYFSSKLVGADGKEILSDAPDSLQPDTQIGSFSPSFTWATDLGSSGARYAAVIAPSIANSSLGAQLDAIGGGVIHDQSEFGQGDLLVAPVWIGRGWDHAYVSGNYAFYAPTGEYSAGAENNIGLGFWSHQLQFAGYYFPVPDQSTPVMLVATFEFSGNQEGTGVKPGHYLSLDWGVGHSTDGGWYFGAEGYAQWQITDATGSGASDPDVHDRVHGIGGELGWTSETGFVSIVGRFLTEFAAINRFEGNLAWGALALNF